MVDERIKAIEEIMSEILPYLLKNPESLNSTTSMWLLEKAYIEFESNKAAFQSIRDANDPCCTH